MSTTPTATTSATTSSRPSRSAWPPPRTRAAVRPPAWAGTSSYSCYPSTTPTTPAPSSKSCAPWRSPRRYAPTTASTPCDPPPAPASPSTTGRTARSPRCSTTPTSPCTTSCSSAAPTGPTTQPCGCPTTPDGTAHASATTTSPTTTARPARPRHDRPGHGLRGLHVRTQRHRRQRAHRLRTSRRPRLRPRPATRARPPARRRVPALPPVQPPRAGLDLPHPTDRSPLLRRHPTDPHAQILAGIHRPIVLTREPGRTLLTTSRWSPAHLKAATIPKIRDRLTGLLRGPVRLPTPLHGAE